MEGHNVVVLKTALFEASYEHYDLKVRQKITSDSRGGPTAN